MASEPIKDALPREHPTNLAVASALERQMSCRQWQEVPFLRAGFARDSCIEEAFGSGCGSTR